MGTMGAYTFGKCREQAPARRSPRTLTGLSRSSSRLLTAFRVSESRLPAALRPRLPARPMCGRRRQRRYAAVHSGPAFRARSVGECTALGAGTGTLSRSGSGAQRWRAPGDGRASESVIDFEVGIGPGKMQRKPVHSSRYKCRPSWLHQPSLWPEFECCLRIVYLWGTLGRWRVSHTRQLTARTRLPGYRPLPPLPQPQTSVSITNAVKSVVGTQHASELREAHNQNGAWRRPQTSRQRHGRRGV